MSKQVARDGLSTRVASAAADFGAAADAVDGAAAELLGVNRTDLRILDAVQRAGAMTAGDAAAAATLSAAATSTAIQRLVAAGLLLRQPDPADRRRAVLTLTPHAADLVERCYGPLSREGRTELRRWSEAELTVIARFLEDGVAFQRRHARRIRSLPHDDR